MATQDNQSKFRKQITYIAIYLAIFLLLVWIVNIQQINGWIANLLSILSPVIVGLCIAYLCNPLFRLFEQRLLSRLRPQGLRRALSLLLAYLTLFFIVTLILLLIIPQLIDSIISFASNYNAYISSAIGEINAILGSVNRFVDRFTGNPTFLQYLNEAEIRQEAADLFSNLDKLSSQLLDALSKVDAQPIITLFSDAVSVITDTIFGIFVSIYLLSTKEKRAAQLMKLRRALFSDTMNERITKLIHLADRSFGRFLEGKILGALIFALLSYVAFSIFGIPYALLIATILGVCNIIPIIGSLIGAIPSALILLLSAPEKLLPFLLIVIVIQQIDNNIISPRILGNNTGVSSLCVMIALTTMSSLWGLFGMIVGVPLFATVLELSEEGIMLRLQRKGLPSGLANYYANDAMVDPIKNAHISSDKSAQRFERTALRIRNMQENGEPLKRKERLILLLYRLAHKYHLLSEMTDETHARFSAEQAAVDAAAEADACIKQRRARAESDASTGIPQ